MTVADETDRLLSIQQAARLLGVNERRARQIIDEYAIRPVTAYSAAAVLAALHDRAKASDLTAVAGGEIVPPDAPLPDVLIHEETGWEVHPNLGMVYSISPTRAPQLLGSIASRGHVAATRKYQDGTRRTFRISRVVWEAVNGRLVPEGWVVIHRNSNKRDNRYFNLVLEPKSVIMDPDHPSAALRSVGE